MLVGFILVQSCIYSKTKKDKKQILFFAWLVVARMEDSDTNFGLQAFIRFFKLQEY